jgi:hypothetical protein
METIEIDKQTNEFKQIIRSQIILQWKWKWRKKNDMKLCLGGEQERDIHW